jgi:hypothetical protein
VLRFWRNEHELINYLKEFKMNPFIIFDNGGRTLDRFTIINKETGDIFGSGEKPDELGGIGKFCGNCADLRIVMNGAGWRQKIPSKKIIKEEVDNYVNDARLDPSWIGTEVNYNNLPVNVRQYILRLDLQVRHSEASKSNVVYMVASSDNLSSGSGVH